MDETWSIVKPEFSASSSTLTGSWPRCFLRCRYSSSSCSGSSSFVVDSKEVCRRCVHSGAISATMSSAVSTSLAPWRISLWQPRASGLWIEPGTANTSRPCSPASRAVISEPLRLAASTTSVPRLIPLIRRLRCGKCDLSGCVPSGNSVARAPFAAISWARSRFEEG